MQISADKAETIGLKALAWLVGNEDLLPVFLSASGTSESELRDRATDPVFLAAVLDFLTMDDAWVIAFCDQMGLAYETPMQARMSLPGGAQVNWT